MDQEKALGKGGARIKNRLVAAGILLAGTLAFQLAARHVPGFGQWYGTTIYPVLEGTIGRITGIFPFSVVEISLYILVIWGMISIVYHHRQYLRLLSGLVSFFALLFFLYTIGCGINYYRKPFSSYMGLETGKYTRQELYQLCQKLGDQANSLSQEAGKRLPASAAGREGVESMELLGERYPQLSGFYPRPKPLAWSWLLSVQQLCGVYSPFTIEANYNREMPAYNIPHTICHELSHLKGFMGEDEANFIGYLACIGSPYPEFRYSGYLNGWVYASNAMAKVDGKAYIQLRRQLKPKVAEDLRQNNRFWDRYQGKVAEVSNTWNDTYLKINGQAGGVQSYGRVVDLMLAYGQPEK